MKKFKSLFGIEAHDIRENCILAPFLTKGLLPLFNLRRLKKGSPYSAASNSHYSFIHTGIGPTFLGDAVLYLKETNCKNIFLFGACGATPESKLDVGDIICPPSALSVESFTQVLYKEFDSLKTHNADQELMNSILKVNQSKNVKKTPCASFGSIKLEEENLDFLQKHNIGVVDLECAAFYAACQNIKRRATALLFITDIIKDRPLFVSSDLKQKLKYAQAISKCTTILKDCIKTLV